MRSSAGHFSSIPGEETFGKWLKDGKILCNVANTIQPGRMDGLGAIEVQKHNPDNAVLWISGSSVLFYLLKWTVGFRLDSFEESNFSYIVDL